MTLFGTLILLPTNHDGIKFPYKGLPELPVLCPYVIGTDLFFLVLIFNLNKIQILGSIFWLLTKNR